MKIILIRHAQVLFNKKTIYPNEMENWLEEYDMAEINSYLPYDKELKNIIDNNIVLTSSLKRSALSLKLYGHTPDKIDKIFNEVSLPYPNWQGFIRLSPIKWRVLFRILWFFGYSKNSESINDARIRAKKAAHLLINTFENDEKNIVLLGHGILNRLIAKELKREGLKTIKKLNNNNWGYGIFELKTIDKKGNSNE